MSDQPASRPTVVDGGHDGMASERWLGAEVWVHADQPRTIVAALDHAVRTHPDRQAVVLADRTVTWVELARLVEGAATSLQDRLHLPRGGRLAVALPNGLDLLVAIYACARAGLVLVGLPTRLQAPQWAHQLSVSGPHTALADPDHIQRLREAADLAADDPATDDPATDDPATTTPPPRPSSTSSGTCWSDTPSRGAGWTATGPRPRPTTSTP